MAGRSLRILLALLFLGGCAVVPLPALPPTHPGNPSAPEANAADPNSAVRDAFRAQESQTAQSYTCSMHPEVHSPSPGSCPKCGMTLVPETAKQPMNMNGGHHAH